MANSYFVKLIIGNLITAISILPILLHNFHMFHSLFPFPKYIILYPNTILNNTAVAVTMSLHNPRCQTILPLSLSLQQTQNKLFYPNPIPFYNSHHNLRWQCQKCDLDQESAKHIFDITNNPYLYVTMPYCTMALSVSLSKSFSNSIFLFSNTKSKIQINNHCCA